MPAQRAFQLTTSIPDPNTLVLSWNIADGYFMYKDRLTLQPSDPNQITIANPEIKRPKALKKINARGETVLIYRHKLRIPINIQGLNPGETLFTLHSQGCSDAGYCYPPETHSLLLTVDTTLALQHAKLQMPTHHTTPQALNSKPSQLSNPFHYHWVITLLLFFGFGVLLSFTPCMLPMIPVLSGIIIGQKEIPSPRRAFLLSLSYVLSMALSYAIVGAFVALLGKNLQVMMQSTGVVVLYSLLFVILALALLNAYPVRLPIAWQTLCMHFGQRIQYQSNRYLSAALMGALSTLILSPCVTAPLIGALSYISQTGNTLFGSLALFSTGLGMGVPLLLIGTSFGAWLPRQGDWMNRIRYLVGILFLSIAITLLSRIVPPLIINLLWVCLVWFSLIVWLTQTNIRLTYPRYFLMFIGAIGAGLSVVYYDNTFNIQTQREPRAYQTITVTTAASAAHALHQAQQQQRPVLMDFYADWCQTCKSIEVRLTQDPKIQTALQGFLLIKADLTANTSESTTLSRVYDVIAPPTLHFYNNQGQEITESRLVGDVSATIITQALQHVSAQEQHP